MIEQSEIVKKIEKFIVKEFGIKPTIKIYPEYSVAHYPSGGTSKQLIRYDVDIEFMVFNKEE